MSTTTLDQLDDQDLAKLLETGLSLRTGPFSFKIRSTRPEVHRGLSRLYAGFPVEPAGMPLHDFHVQIDRVDGPRRWIQPQVNFWLDDFSPFKPLPADHAFALLEWGMNWCLAGHAHHYLMLHAAVLERRGACIILPGVPGAGKSTLTAALMLAGWRLLSDELTLVDREDGSLIPLARPISLKNESIAIIRARAPEAVIGEVAADTHKGSVAHLRPSAASVAAMGEPGRAHHLIFPTWQAQAPTELTPRPKASAFEHAALHAFNYSLLGRLGFELTAGLVDACDCWDFRYSELDEALATFESLCP